MKRIRQTPLKKLWTEQEKEVNARRGRDMTTTDIQDALRVGPVQFVVANVGETLRWIPMSECFQFWKSIKANIANENAFYLEDFPGEFAYSVTEWNDEDSNQQIILLEMHH